MYLNQRNQVEGASVAITGGAGFIGSSLAVELTKLGADVIIIDSMIPKYGGNIFNLSEIANDLTINLSDIRDPYSLEALLKGKDFIFNLAGQTSHMDSMTDPGTDLEINCKAQLSLLEICRNVCPEARIIFASTRQLYGKPKYLPVNEDHPVKPVDVNGINKLSAELYHSLYQEVYGLSCGILRLTNTIGPRMRIKDARQTFVGIWIRNLLLGQPIEVWGGDQWRDFNDVDDVVNALIILAMKRDLPIGPYNLGNEERIRLKDLAVKMIEINGGGELKVIPYPEERAKIDIGDYYSSHEKFTSLCGWKPNITLDDTLNRTINYYKAYSAHYL